MKIHKFIRIGEGGSEIDLWHAERDGGHYLLYFEKNSGIKWDVLAKGRASAVSSEFDRFVRNKMERVGQFGATAEVLADRVDSTAKKRLKIFTEPFLGQETDWEKAEDVSDKTEEELEQADFAEYLERQLKSWRGGFSGKGGFNNIVAVSRHAYWPTFLKMVRSAVKSQYGGRIKLYRGIFGNTAKSVLQGNQFPVSKLSSWTTDKGEAKDHAMYWSKKGFWLVVEHSFSASDVVMAPVVLPDFKPDPRILMPLKKEEEFIILSGKRELPVKVIAKSRKKMSKKAIAQKIYEDEISRRVTAGLFEPPPKMVDDIVAWIFALVAYNERFDIENLIDAYEEVDWSVVDAKDEDQLWESGLTLGAIKMIMEMGPKAYIRKLERHAQKLKKIIAASPKPVKYFSRKWQLSFKVDLTGWKYLPRVKQAGPEALKLAKRNYPSVKVNAVIDILEGASWSPMSAKLEVGIWRLQKATSEYRRELRSTVKHEMRHFSQDFLSLIVGAEEKVGLPSRKTRTPEVEQSLARETKYGLPDYVKRVIKKLEKQGITKDIFHDLDDAEFYTELGDVIEDIAKNLPEYAPEHRMSALLSFMAGGEKVPGAYPSRFMKSLKRFAPGKWKKAVKEIAKVFL